MGPAGRVCREGDYSPGISLTYRKDGILSKGFPPPGVGAIRPLHFGVVRTVGRRYYESGLEADVRVKRSDDVATTRVRTTSRRIPRTSHDDHLRYRTGPCRTYPETYLNPGGHPCRGGPHHQ